MDNDLRVDSNLLNQENSDDEIDVPSIEQMLPCRGNITAEVVERLEPDLDFYERVSLVFLLYDNADVALQRLKVAEVAFRNGRLPPCGLVSDWARHTVSSHWESKFLEALCIIQNYSIVEKLNYHKNDVVQRFLPQTPDVCLFVDQMRKSLYRVCEELTEDQTRTLIDLVNADRPTESEFPSLTIYEPHQRLLEIQLLHWMSQKYIIIEHGVVDVSNLTKHLKVMEESHLVDYLDSVSKRYESTTLEDDVVSAVGTESLMSSAGASYLGNNNNVQTHSKTSACVDTSSIGDFDIPEYVIDPKNVGICVIINQKNFYREPSSVLQKYVAHDVLEDRVGTDIDKDRLCEAFGHFGFKIQIWEDLTHIQILEYIDKATKELVQENHSCFVLCILSHGIEKHVYGVNSICVSIESIEARIQGKHCPKLLNKPKIIIIQACQGQKQQDALYCNSADLTVDGPNQSTCPEISDSLIMWSTIPGYASFRHKITGSWYIQCLCRLLLKATKGVDMCKVATAVNYEIKSKAANIGMEMLKTMQPQHVSRLCKTLYLPCSVAARKQVAEIMVRRHVFDEMLTQYLQREYRSTIL